MIEDIINPSVRLGGEVPLNDLVEQLSALVEQPGQHVAVEGVVHLMETDRRHGELVHFLLEFLHQGQLIWVELVVPVQDGQLNDGLDEVLDDLLSLFLVLGVLLGHSVQLIQHFAACVVDQGGGDRFGHHFTQDLLLCLDGQVFGIKDICGHFIMTSSKPAVKRKIDDEHRQFQEKWETQYFFVEHRGIPTCLICSEKVAVHKEYNLKRHYSTKHAEECAKCQGNERAKWVASLKSMSNKATKFLQESNQTECCINQS